MISTKVDFIHRWQLLELRHIVIFFIHYIKQSKGEMYMIKNAAGAITALSVACGLACIGTAGVGCIPCLLGAGLALKE